MQTYHIRYEKKTEHSGRRIYLTLLDLSSPESPSNAPRNGSQRCNGKIYTREMTVAIVATVAGDPIKKEHIRYVLEKIKNP